MVTLSSAWEEQTVMGYAIIEETAKIADSIATRFVFFPMFFSPPMKFMDQR